MSLRLSRLENVVCHAELCSALKPHVGTAITACIFARQSIGHHGSRTGQRLFQLSIRAHRLMLGRSLLLAHCIILSLQALNWVSKFAAGFELSNNQFMESGAAM